MPTEAETRDSSVGNPCARVDPSAVLGRGVVVEQGAYVGPGCVIGDGCRLMAGSVVLQHATLGEGNVLYPFAVIGGDPQDIRFDPATPGKVIVGDGNTFREHVTVNRATLVSTPTTIGSGCRFLTRSHVGHDSTVGDGVVLGPGTMLGGHSRVGDGVRTSTNVGIHQFTHIGDMVMAQSGSGLSMHTPPFVMVTALNHVYSLNVRALREDSSIGEPAIEELKILFRMFYRERGARPLLDVAREARERSWSEPGERFISFIEEAVVLEPPRARGVAGPRGHVRSGRVG